LLLFFFVSFVSFVVNKETTMSKLNLPGAAWIALLTFATSWLQQYFGDVQWVPVVVALLGGAVKAIQLISEPMPEPAPRDAVGAAHDDTPARPSTLTRWLLG
jgi:hypothetical protein